MKSHATGAPSQVAIEFSGGMQAVHIVPHEFVLVSSTHRPLQLCVPDGQVLLHAIAFGIQAPAQSFIPVGQLPPQLVPSHVAVPPVGATQAVQDDKPQFDVSMSETHCPLQLW